MNNYIVFFAAWMLGAFPTAWLCGRVKRKDLRAEGSGNLGATNAFRVLGKGWGVIVLLGDALKGMGATLLGFLYFGPWGGIVAGLLAMLGHSFNPLFGFRPSGKGVAVGLGIVVMLLPREAVLAVLVFAVVLLLWHYVSLASVVAALVLLIAVFIWREPLPYRLFSVLAVGLLVLRHRANLGRLRRGEEPKIF